MKTESDVYLSRNGMSTAISSYSIHRKEDGEKAYARFIKEVIEKKEGTGSKPLCPHYFNFKTGGVSP